MRYFMLAMVAGSAVTAMPVFAADTATFAGLEAKWAEAQVARDITTIDGIVAADWHEQNPGGKVTTKADYLADLTSGKLATSSMTPHDITARTFGDIAVVQGADDEKGSYAGKDTSGAYTWTDVFQKRGDKWLVIASQVTLTMK